MSKIEKLIERFKSKPKDFTYNELKTLLYYFGFYEDTKGRTSGSRIIFKNENGCEIQLHKPHPSNVIKPYMIKDVFVELKERGII